MKRAKKQSQKLVKVLCLRLHQSKPYTIRFHLNDQLVRRLDMHIKVTSMVMDASTVAYSRTSSTLAASKIELGLPLMEALASLPKS